MQLYVLFAQRQLKTCLIEVNLKYCILYTEYSLLSDSITVLYPFFFFQRKINMELMQNFLSNTS